MDKSSFSTLMCSGRHVVNKHSSYFWTWNHEKEIVESQNGFGWKGPQRSPGSKPCCRKGHQLLDQALDYGCCKNCAFFRAEGVLFLLCCHRSSCGLFFISAHFQKDWLNFQGLDGSWGAPLGYYGLPAQLLSWDGHAGNYCYMRQIQFKKACVSFQWELTMSSTVISRLRIHTWSL